MTALRRLFNLACNPFGVWKRIMPVLCCFIIDTAAGMGDTAYTLVHFDNENGLPQNSAFPLLTDKAGYLWFATQGGLVRFDGVHFMIFNAAAIPGMRSDRIIWLGTDQEGTVFFCNEFNQLYKQHTSCSFQPVSYIDSAHMTGIYKEDTDVRWLPLSLYYRGQHTNKNATGRMAVTENGDVYNYYYAGPTHKITGEFLYGDSVTHLFTEEFEYGAVSLLFGDTICFMGKNGLVIFVHKGSVLSVQKNKDLAWGGAGKGFVIPGREHYLYDQYNLYQLYLDTSLQIRKRLLFSHLPCEHIVSVLRLPGTQIYALGTFADGLYLVYPKSFRHVFYGNSARDENNITYAVAAWKDEIITGRYSYRPGTGVRLWNKHTKKAEDYAVRFLFADRKGRLWFPEEGKLKKTADLSYFTTVASDRWLGDHMLGMGYSKEDSNKLLYVTRDDIGLIRNDSAIQLIDALPFLETVKDRFTTFLVHDSILMMGSNKGLYAYHIRSNTLHTIDTASMINIRTIYKDRDGLIWVGTYGQGLHLFRNGSLTRVPADRKYSLSIIHCIFEDHSGYFWLSTNHGIYKTRKKELLSYFENQQDDIYYYSFHKMDGLPFYELNGGCMPCAMEDQSGQVWFPSLKGLISFSPEKAYVNTTSGAVQFDYIEIDGVRQDDLRQVTLPNGFFQLAIYLSCPYFSNPENLQIEYRIAGHNNDVWQRLDNGKIIFNALPTGHYNLVTRKKEGFGEQYSFSSLSFEVLPAFYETLWFRTLFIAGVILLLIIIFRLRYRYILIHNLRLEEEVRARTRLQQQLISDLQESNASLKISEKNLSRTVSEKERLVSVLIHDLRSPIRFLKNNIYHLSRNWKKYSPQELNDMFFTIDDTTKQIHFLAEELMYWVSTRSGKYLFDVREYRLSEIVNDLVALYGEIVTHSNNQLIVEAPGDIVIKTERTLLKTILRNLLDNANKNTESGIITIRCSVHAGKVQILVSDSGMGMPPATLHEMNAYFEGAVTDISQQSQFGHRIIRDFVMLLEGQIRYMNNPEQGILVILELPAGQAS